MDAQRLLQQLVGPLQRSPGLRGTVYLGTAAALMQTVGGWFDHDKPVQIALIHPTIFPLGAAVTAAALALEGRSPRELLPTRHDCAQVVRGFGAGGASRLAFLALLRAAGWASSPRWGWEDAPLGQVLGSVALMTVEHLAVAWNEEQVFRGYGFDTLEASIGTAGASAVLVPLFASAHPFIPSVLVIQGVAGALLLAQRLTTGSIWFGVGFHWASNLMEAAVFGPTDGLPSLRPLHFHGPKAWVGRPGHPEPGLLDGLVSLVELAAIGAVWWRKKREMGR
jgi:membrane protease YdiL (CAAX protease family)